jgi:endonuclease YncB( thermonuclease family)
LVIRAKDGDSLVVEIDGREEDVRLIGINAPELAECWGPEARSDLAQVEGKTVRLGSDAEPRDQYGRLLAYVWDGDVLVNAELVANGSAIASAFGANSSLTRQIEANEDTAKDARVGMWGPDACGDPTPIDLAIVAINANPPGPDDEHLDEEYVTIVNRGSNPIPLGGMVLRDASTAHRFSFPSGATIDPGQEVRVVTGCGTDTATTLHWCAGGPVWDNAGDDALLTTAKGTIVAHLDYGT